MVSLFNRCLCPPARDSGSRVYGLVSNTAPAPLLVAWQMAPLKFLRPWWRIVLVSVPVIVVVAVAVV